MRDEQRGRRDEPVDENRHACFRSGEKRARDHRDLEAAEGGERIDRIGAPGTTFEDLFADARLNPNASLITGGVRVENVEDPLMQKIRYLDKLVDELARGKSMDKILRS